MPFSMNWLKFSLNLTRIRVYKIYNLDTLYLIKFRNFVIAKFIPENILIFTMVITYLEDFNCFLSVPG